RWQGGVAAEISANITASEFPAPDPKILQAIALHDAGWGMPDAQAIMKSRSVHPRQAQSFVAMPVAEFVEAWKQSIETCQSTSPAGGYIVSRHFYRLAEHRVGAGQKESKDDARRLESFLTAEERRQKKLAGKESLSIQQLEQLTDLLQLCDLLSLYMCSGASENVVFPNYFGVELLITNNGES